MFEVTVLLPVYNGEKYLLESVQSILQQTFSDFEFLIVDDGSTDRSADIIASFGDSRIRVLKNPERLKLSGALNRGIQEAKGKYIARMDADDIAMPGRLEGQFRFMEQHPDVGVCGSAIEIFGRKQQTRVNQYPADAEEIKAYALFDCPFCHPAVMIRKDLLQKHGLEYDGSYYPTEDYELWARATLLFQTANIDEILLRYRVHDESMTGSDWDRMDSQAARIIGGLLDRLAVRYSEEDLRFHRNIGRGKSCQITDITEFERAERWLQKLVHANTRNPLYDIQALDRIVSLVWYRLCINNSFHGMKVVRKYIGSVLVQNDTMKRKRGATLLLSAFKRSVFSVNTH